jgi:hypothetical protein
MSLILHNIANIYLTNEGGRIVLSMVEVKHYKAKTIVLQSGQFANTPTL